MALDDLIDNEIGVAVAATAAVASPRARHLLRQGAVYGLAGAMRAGDVVFGAARGAVRGAAAGVSPNGSSTASAPRRSVSASTSRTRSRSAASTRSAARRPRSSNG